MYLTYSGYLSANLNPSSVSVFGRKACQKRDDVICTPKRRADIKTPLGNYRKCSDIKLKSQTPQNGLLCELASYCCKSCYFSHREIVLVCKYRLSSEEYRGQTQVTHTSRQKKYYHSSFFFTLMERAKNSLFKTQLVVECLPTLYFREFCMRLNIKALAAGLQE